MLTARKTIIVSPPKWRCNKPKWRKGGRRLKRKKKRKKEERMFKKTRKQLSLTADHSLSRVDLFEMSSCGKKGGGCDRKRKKGRRGNAALSSIACPCLGQKEEGKRLRGEKKEREGEGREEHDSGANCFYIYP